MNCFDASCFCRGAEQLVVKTTPAHAKEVPTRKTYVYQRPQLGDTIFYASEYCNDTQGLTVSGSQDLDFLDPRDPGRDPEILSLRSKKFGRVSSQSARKARPRSGRPHSTMNNHL